MKKKMTNKEIFESLKYQEGGDHYSKMKVQPAYFINENNLPFAEGNAIKYICRHKHKFILGRINFWIDRYPSPQWYCADTTSLNLY